MTERKKGDMKPCRTMATPARNQGGLGIFINPVTLQPCGQFLMRYVRAFDLRVREWAARQRMIKSGPCPTTARMRFARLSAKSCGAVQPKVLRCLISK